MISDHDRVFYSTAGLMTLLPATSPLFTNLPTDPLALRELVSAALLHPFWAQAYGVTIAPVRADEQQQRYVADMSQSLLQLSAKPLTEARSVDQRLFGTCRNFTTFYVGLLRFVGIAARARCGFASYFERDKWVDHWIAEYWNDDQNRWIQVDPQLDDFQRKSVNASWSPDDLPAGVFLSGGECWQGIRGQSIDPSMCGIFDNWGAWFVRSNVVRDLAALNKVELLPWDVWGFMNDWSSLDSPEDNAIVDDLAAVCSSNDLLRAQMMYADARFVVPAVVTSFLDSGPVEVTLRIDQ